MLPAPEPRFPLPPLDLPHYHGLGLDDPVLSSAAVSGSVQGDATGVTKEVTGA